ncbi:hypothetical protein A2456_00735 [Candidatus Nomurabacteria bacterium RIFOXYC2_FULL_36_19]|uniref:PKD domain-containing protein n=2 Tax=Candidatus Nomuraibacteriota TaxID=1752729 RepID=A0A1F6YS86_9BACT|nr:MAG: hypothetical protein UR91_C0003G0013 [Candidatus Nomurabacteria bacterium GW2011_GWC2_35_8]OGJ05621.1 MAG: hypothetical protein A2238_02290 [Candidatus Nomurabacteria bacterium RIFOXYA2_FULL_35_9]OGJ09234.1 MAG: hypothetical protein A2456_00735 [Candidatus Nomurabacteria bacterium RIFOXYC2_FULL_36_19]OGJ14240.1 MAG: hypothetical protein A2554_01770 [Candidatus Nomurabacteria bacterium RIFOXYD2_FULL_35_12]
MKEYKKLIFIIVVALFFSLFNLARAEVLINEVQVKPTGESFIELYNFGSSQDLTNWTIKRRTASGSEYSLVSASRLKDKSISANSYFLLVNENYIGEITPDTMWAKSYDLANDNTILLYNENENLISKISWGGVVDCTSSCPANPPEGQSIQKTSNGSWVSATPTPGAVNSSLSSDSNNSNNTSSTSVTTEIKTKTSEIPKIKTKILAKNFSFVGIPMIFEANATGYSNEILSYGRYFWNFGDGDSLEVKMSENKKFTHTYFYGGEYDVTLEYYQNYYGDVPDASDKMIVKVVEASIFISRVGEEKDFFIELSNNTNYDADISNWILSSNGKSFTIPRNTTIGAKRKMIISPKITGFSILDRDTLKLLTSQWETVFDYGASVIKFTPKKVASATIAQTPSLILPLSKGETSKVDGVNTDVQVSAENLPASAISSDVVKDNPIRTYFLSFILTIFIGASAGVVYFIRQKKVVSSAGDDFKILDE